MLSVAVLSPALWAGSALVLLAAVVFYVEWRARMRRRIYEGLMDGAPTGAPIGAARIDEEDLAEPELTALESWLATAGYEGRGIAAQFVLWVAGALLTAAFLALLLDSTGFVERAVLWLEEIPGGIAEIFVPVMRAATWLLALLVALLPIAIVRRARRARQQAIERDLPNVLNLLATLVESGLGFDAAALRVERAMGQDRLLARELARVRASTLAGVPRTEAIRDMARRLDVPSLTTFSSALIHADTQGASIGGTLRQQATDLWSRRREEAIQRAQTLPTKLAFPLVICFLPGVFVWTFGPAVADFVRLASDFVAGQP